MYYYEYALSDYETFEPIVLAHEKKFGKVKFRRYIEQAHKIMCTEQKYIDMIRQGSIHKNEFGKNKYQELETDLGYNYGVMDYYVTQDSVHEIIVQVLVDKFDFTLIEIQAGYYYRHHKFSCIEVPDDIVEVTSAVTEEDDSDEDEWYIDFLIEENE